MSAILEPKPLSISEFLVGSMALVAVLLIVFSSLRLPQQGISLPAAPLRYATTSIQSPAAESAREKSNGLSDEAGAARDVRLSDVALATHNATLAAQKGANILRSPIADGVAALAMGRPNGLRNADVADGQQYAMNEGSLVGFPDVLWGPPLPTPPRDTRFANGQKRHVPNASDVRLVNSFIGAWTDDIDRCRSGQSAPLVISSHAAKTASGECDFGSVARHAENRWRVTAICAANGTFWRANIDLELTKSALTWSSERGAETYVRCRR